MQEFIGNWKNWQGCNERVDLWSFCSKGFIPLGCCLKWSWGCSWHRSGVEELCCFGFWRIDWELNIFEHASVEVLIEMYGSMLWWLFLRSNWRSSSFGSNKLGAWLMLVAFGLEYPMRMLCLVLRTILRLLRPQFASAFQWIYSISLNFQGYSCFSFYKAKLGKFQPISGWFRIPYESWLGNDLAAISISGFLIWWAFEYF